MGKVGPLAGLRVVESCGWSGAFAGRLLADAGADVLRVAPPEGDWLGAEPPFFGDSGVSIQATWYNAGKRVVSLDLGETPGREQFLSLIENADMVLEDWPADSGPFSPEEIAGRNGAIVHVSITAMGEGGPWANLRTNDLVANALSGAASVTGNVETPPITGY
ncbi:MAG TPA: CoA transferase, partial [Tepidiformaceae bacterium]|nr:CoA transferase [Tepidiformaceae bacterium]